MRRLSAWLSCLLILMSPVSCKSASAPATASPADPDAAPLVLLIGLDGLHPDMISRQMAPHISALAQRGVRAQAMYPVMPSVTFVNFYSIATGLYPEHHGMVDNAPYDRLADEQFDRARGPTEARWWQGEPIWITAEKQGLPTAIMFWLGSETSHAGLRPSVWTPYQHDKPYQERVDEVLAWYDVPQDRQPRFAAVYFDRVDSAGHYFGPDSPEVRAAVTEVDTYVGQLIEGLARRGLNERITIIIVSDHGMAAIDPGKVIDVGGIMAMDSVHVPQFRGAYAGSNHTFLHIYAEPDVIDQTHEALEGFHPNLHVYRRGAMPAHYRFDYPGRGPDLFLVADPGWSVRNASLGGWRAPIPGQHGYDSRSPEMAASFVGAGPIFPKGQTVEAFENVNVYLMIACALGIVPATTDGDRQLVENITGGRCPAGPSQE